MVSTIFFSCNTDNKDLAVDKTNNRITQLISASKNSKNDTTIRASKLHEAYELNKNIKNDSIQLNHLIGLSNAAYRLKKINLFKKINFEVLTKAIETNDTYGIAKAHQYTGFYFLNEEINDSAYFYYYKSHRLYKSIKKEKNVATTLHNMALIHARLKDYTASTEILFNVVTIHKKFKNHKSLYNSNTILGSIYRGIEDYENSFKYHYRALNHVQKINNKKTYQEGVYNNIGLTYKSQGKYPEAISYFKKALKTDSLFFKKSSLFAKLKDNLAHTRLLNGDTLEVKKELLKALRIRENLNSKSGIVINSLHLAEYFLMQKDTVNALPYAKKASTIAQSVDNKRDILTSLTLLSKLEPKKANVYFQQFQTVTKELNSYELNLRNKVARIRFETDEHIEEVNKQATQKFQIALASVLLIIILSLLYFVRHQKAKNKELQLETEQQRANENIYSLLLKQQSKLEEGQLNERHRISQELHDGVLGKIFATRMRLDFLDIEGSSEIQDKYHVYLEELQAVEKEIRIISHELKNELIHDSNDFTKIIEQLVTDQSEILNFKYAVENETSIPWIDINNHIKINCYRIIQEALQNINKHSKANNVFITLNFDNVTLRLKIIDDGVGFDTNKHKNGIGLQNINSRVTKLNGIFVVSSAVGKGSTYHVEIPIKV